MVRSLLEWFRLTARDLPWRRSQEPYKIWVSEIMLQQTQVSTVLPYYERWMAALPSVEAVAKAPEPQLLKLWEGLGYYTRVRNLQRAAKVIQERHGGVFPRQHEEVLALPGVGRYTAGAICSIAFDEPTPVLDGNVARVLSRVYAIGGDAKDAATRATLWKLADELVKAASQVRKRGNRCGRLNESLMELGALICRASAPTCEACPIAGFCAAFQQNAVERFPGRKARPRIKHERLSVYVVTDGRKVLMRQRPAGVPNAGFWEFPTVECNGRSGPMPWPGLRRLVNGKPSSERLKVLTHVIMNSRIWIHPELVRAAAVKPMRGLHLIQIEDLAALPLSTVSRKVLKACGLKPA